MEATEFITLYHATKRDPSQMGKNIKLSMVPYSDLDFGAGFYTTTDLEQAKDWALKNKDKWEVATSYIYEFKFQYSEALKNLNILHFNNRNEFWLKELLKNREKETLLEVDMAIGPLLMGKLLDDGRRYTIDDIRRMSERSISKALDRIDMSKSDQFVFISNKSLEYVDMCEKATII